MMGELAGGGSVAVDVAVTVRLQATGAYYPQCPSASLFFFLKIFSNLFHTCFAIGDVYFRNGLI